MSPTASNIKDGVIEKTQEGEVVISVKNVSKKFCRHLRRSMKYGIIDLSKNLVGIKPDSTSLRKDEFWAVKDLSFELRKGEVLGIIGANGSGKSTLLRLLTGIFPPDKGEITIKGRVGALIAVGAGFHPHMTGRENIYLNGTILGMSRAEIDEVFDSIVDFSEIGDFLDAPVSTYSSGMRVRLGFSIATAIQLDILLVDEVLAVGDAGFRTKALNRMREMMSEAAVIFVSHSMPQVARISSSIMIMDKGHGKLYDDPEIAVNDYLVLYESEQDSSEWFEGSNRISKVAMRVSSGDAARDGMLRVNFGEAFSITMDASIEPQYRKLELRIRFVDGEQDTVTIYNSVIEGNDIVNPGGPFKISIDFDEMRLFTGKFYLTLTVIDIETEKLLVRSWNCLAFRVLGDTRGGRYARVKGSLSLGKVDNAG